MRRRPRVATPAPVSRPTIEEALALLENPDFRKDTFRVLQRVVELRKKAVDPNTVPREVERLGMEFEKRWGILPPTTGEVLDQDPRRWISDSVAAGQWGVLLVTPLTTNRQIRDAIQRIRRVVHKRHQDALVRSRAQLVQWLETAFSRPMIARAVFGRRTGLRRPTKAQAIAQVSDDRQTKLFAYYESAGLSYREAEQRVYKILRGSEALASATIRMSERRYARRLERLIPALERPAKSEPVSHALTMLFRALPDVDDATTRRLAQGAKAAFERALRAATSLTGRAARLAGRQTTEQPWAIIPIFPWTTDPEVRAQVARIRKALRRLSNAENNEGRRPKVLESELLSHALWQLVRALTGNDDAVRRDARAARAAILKLKTPQA
jgi:hypothetical protein